MRRGAVWAGLLLVCLSLLAAGARTKWRVPTAAPKASTGCDPNYNSSGYFGCGFSDADGIRIIAAGGLNLGHQSGWSYYNSPDAPEGAWLSYGHDVLTGAITLPTALSAGTTYYIFTHFGDYDVHRDITYSCGDASSDTIRTDDRDFNRLWTTRNTLTTGSSCSSIDIVIGGNTSTDSARLLRAIYITTDTTVTVTLDGTAVNLTYPTVMDNSEPTPGNLIANSSFEAGLDAGWSLYGSKTFSLDSIWDNTGEHTGNAQLKIPLDASYNLAASGTIELVSRVYHLKPNKQYAFSAWVKVASGTFGVVASAHNTFIPPAGYKPQPTYSASINASTNWQRICLENTYLLSYPTPDFYFMLHSNNNSPGNYLYVDDVQLEEGASCTRYTPSLPMEVVVSTDKPGHIYFTSDTLTATLRAQNTTASSFTKTIQYEIRDYLNSVVASGSTNITVSPRAVSTATISLSTAGKTGAFRLLYWISDLEGADKEFSYSIIPPTTASADATSYMGIHPNYSVFQAAAYQRLGIKWYRDLSPQALCRWETVEPTEGTFVWQDAAVSAVSAYNAKTMCTIGAVAPFSALPAYMKDGSGINLSKWSTYVTAVVKHYKPKIDTWEIWNEPHAQYTMNQYAHMLKTAVDAIEAEDSKATIICMGGMSIASINSAISELANLFPTWDPKAHCDAYSSHDYPNGLDPATLTPLVNRGVPVWNTETGYWSFGPFVGGFSNWVALGRQVLPFYDANRFYREFIDGVTLVVENFAATVAAKQTKYFYYDGRIYENPTTFKHHPTIMEFDGSIRTKGVAYGIAGHFLDHTTGRGNIAPGRNSTVFFSYASGNDPIAVLFSSDRKSRQVALNGVAHENLALFDVMGNAIAFSGTTIPYGRFPVYLKGVGLSIDAFERALSRGTLSLRTDTAAPNVSLAAAPRGPVSSNRFRVRWFAVDDISFPNLGEYDTEAGAPSDVPNPDAITYSYRLEPYSDWSPYSQTTWIDYSGVPNGTYTFRVKAKDMAENVSAEAARTLTVTTTTRK